MSKKVKILVFTALFIIAIISLIHFQAKRIVQGLIESNTSDRLEVQFKRLSVNLFNSSLSLHDLRVKIRAKDSDNFKESTIKKVFLDVASMWDFYSGGTLIIEKLELEGGDVMMYSPTTTDSIRNTFDLSSIIERIKKDAVRFQIQDIAFIDFNLTLVKDSISVPTSIKHLMLHAKDLYLSVDSVIRRKPLIEFFLPHQAVVTPQGLGIEFDNLFFSTRNNSIQVSNLELKSPDNPSDKSYRVKAEKVRIAYFDFESLYDRGVVVIDSVFLGRSDLSVKWTLDHAQKKREKSSGIPALPEITIRNLNIDDLASEISIHQDSIENSFHVDHAYVTAERLRHHPDSSQKFSVHDFNILLARYSTFLSNKTTAISFDTVRLQKDRLSLLNFKLNKATQEQPILETPSFGLEQVDWYALLLDKRLVAREALVMDPIVHTSIQIKSDKDPADNLVLLNTLREFLEVKLFSLRNATAYVRFTDKHTDIMADGMYATVWIDEMMESKDINQGLSGIQEFSIRQLNVRHPQFNGRIEKFNFQQGAPFFGNITMSTGEQLIVSVVDLSLGKFLWEPSQKLLAVNGLHWKTMRVDATIGSSMAPSNALIHPEIWLKSIRGGETKVDLKTPELTLNTQLANINVDELQWNDFIKLDGINLSGNDLNYNSPSVTSSIGTYSMNNRGGALGQIRFSSLGKDSLTTTIDQIVFQADIPAMIDKKFKVEQLAIKGATSHYRRKDSIQHLEINAVSHITLSDVDYSDRKFSIRSLFLESGPIDVLHTARVKKSSVPKITESRKGLKRLRMELDSALIENHSIKSMQQAQNEFKDQPVSQTDTSDFIIKSNHIWGSEGSVQLSLSKVEAMPDSIDRFRASLNAIVLEQVSFKNNTISAQIHSGTLHDFLFKSSYLTNLKEGIIENYDNTGIRNFKSTITTPDHLFQFARLDYDPRLSKGSLKGLEFRPLKTKQEYLDESYYQTNFMDIMVDSISFSQFDLKRFITDSVMHLKSLYIGSPGLEIHRDKTHPFFSTAVKLLPTNALQKAEVKFKLDTLYFGDGKIRYTEKSRITGKEGSIYFTGLQGMVTNVKNIEMKQNDSLSIFARTRFMDSARVVLKVRESYYDSLAGFLMTTQVGPFHTSILNKALVPMVAVDFKSGVVDTLQMNALGREYLSLGSMKFFYHDLKVDFLDVSDTSKHSLRQQLLKFAANTFVIRTNNKKRLGTVFYVRDRNRAVFQYWVKMILSGATTSVGAKSNRKQIKKYLKDLNQKKLPPINEGFDL